jgi:hypothetical protein
MLRKVLFAATAAAVILPSSVSAQLSFGVAARGGSLGLGGEAAVGFSRFVTVRAGIGVLPLGYTGEAEDVRYRIEATSPLSNFAVDFYPGLADLRISGGMLFFPEPTTFDGRYSGTVQIGNNTYTDEEVGELMGELDHGSSAPFVMIGLGRQTNRGIGIFFDLGAAFMKEQRFTYEVTGGIAADPSHPRYAEFQANLEAERQDIEDTVNEYLKFYPIVSAGIRFGFGF